MNDENIISGKIVFKKDHVITNFKKGIRLYNIAEITYSGGYKGVKPMYAWDEVAQSLASTTKKDSVVYMKYATLGKYNGIENIQLKFYDIIKE